MTIYVFSPRILHFNGLEMNVATHISFMRIQKVCKYKINIAAIELRRTTKTTKIIKQWKEEK